MNEEVLRLLRFTNSVNRDEEVVIERCEDFVGELATYYVVLPYSKFSDMEFFVNEQFGPSYIDVISNTFSGECTDAYIAQMCKLFLGGDKTYTELFINSSGGIPKLIGMPIGSGLFNNSDYQDEEMEDPEVIKELEEKLALLAEKHAEALKELDNKEEELNKAKEVIESLEPVKDFYLNLDDVDMNDADMIGDFLESLEDEDAKALIAGILVHNIGDADLEDPNLDLNDLIGLKIYLNQISNYLGQM